MNLLVDIGNTRIKLALTERGRVADECSVRRLEAEALDGWLAGRSVEKAIVSSTRAGEWAAEAAALLRPRVGRFMLFTPSTPVPIGNDYLTPRTLGCDRLAAAVGVATLYAGRNVLVVDFGTAVTVDLVTADGTFRGGCISPGMQSRFRALHEHTGSLPLCAESDAAALVGRTTREAIEAGVMNSLAFEIEGYIARMREKFGDLCVIFTGGDAKCFAKRIKNTIFANCNLVFCGLDRILEFNASEEHLD